MICLAECISRRNVKRRACARPRHKNKLHNWHKFETWFVPRLDGLLSDLCDVRLRLFEQPAQFGRSESKLEEKEASGGIQ